MTNLAFIFVLFVLCADAEINEDNESDFFYSRNVFVKNTFGNLLKSIVKINEQRVDAMKKLNGLHDVNAAINVLRNGRQDSSERHDSLLAFLILDENKSLKHDGTRLSVSRTDSSDDSDSDSSTENEEIENEGKKSLRVWSSCQKKAAKVCKKACVEAYKTTCSEYACSKKMKKTFKKECKIACKNRFH